MFAVPKMGLQEFQVVQIHGKAQTVQQGGKAHLVQSDKPGHGFHSGRSGMLHPEGFHLVKGRFPRFHGVDNVVLDFFHVLCCQRAGEQINLCRADGGALPAGEQLDALGGGVRPLVELTGEGFHGEHSSSGGEGGVYVVHLRLREHGVHGPLKIFDRQALCVVSVHKAQPRQDRDAQNGLQFTQKRGGFLPQRFLLFNVDPLYHYRSSITASALRPMSCLMYAPSNWTVSAVS